MEERMVTDADLQLILDEYNKSQMCENMAGPGVSFFAHIIVLTLLFILIVVQPKKYDSLVKITVIEEKIVELQPEIKEEIEDLTEDTVEDPVDDPTDAPNDDMVGTESALIDISDEAPMTDDNSDAMEYMDFVETKSALTMPLVMSGRTKGGREGLRKKHGGSKPGAKSVNRALRWLASVQNTNGSWGSANGWNYNGGHPAHTGMALLVFLAHGETPLSEKYGMTVQKAMRWLAGYATQSELHQKVRRRHGAYTHGIATYAICEAYAMTKIPTMRTAMELAVTEVVDGQDGVGGFGYGYTSTRWDTSVSGWNFQALKAARMAGSSNPKLANAIKKSITFCKSTAHVGSGKFAYAQNSKGARGNMGGVGIVSLQLLGMGKDRVAVSGCEAIGGDRLKKYQEVAQDASKWNTIGGENLYGWYYDTQAMFNSCKTDKKRWKAWRNAFETVLIRSQHPEGYWQTNGKHGIGAPTTDGRVLSTCLCALQLEVYYRYLPTFDVNKMNTFAKQDEIGIDGVGEEGMVINIEL